MNTTWFLPALLIAFIDWIAVGLNAHNVRRITKPATLLALIASFSFALAGRWEDKLVVLGIGLIFSLAGDIFLMKELVDKNERLYFPLGLASFLVVQVLYTIYFLVPLSHIEPAGIIVVLFGFVVVLVAKRVLEGLQTYPDGSKLRLPVSIYMIAIGLMVASALLTLFRPDWNTNASLLVSAGALLFFISDSILGYSQFVSPLPRADLLLTITYHLGQMMIIYGALSQCHFL